MASESSVPWGSPVVRVVLLSTVLAPLGVPLVSPALPVVKATFGLSDAETSLLISAYFATGIVLSPVLGLLADRLGRRRVLLSSLAVFSVAGASIALGPPFWVVVAIRVVQGTAAAGIFITTATLIGDTFEGARRNAVFGANTAVLSTGAAVYPLVGGALAGVAWNAPFVAYLLGLPILALAYWVLPETPVERTAGGGYARGVLSALAPAEAAALYGTAFALELLLFGGLITTMPFLLSESYAFTPVAIGVVLTVAEGLSAVAAAANGRASRVLSNYGIVALGFACVAIGFDLAWAATGPVLTAAGASVAAAGWGFALPSVDAEMTSVVPGRFRAGALSLRNSTTFLGRAAGPLVFTGLAPSLGYPRLLLLAGVVALACGGTVLVLSQR